ncbi:MAG: hypothetical protein AABW49_00585 [Nanoarchaeota archaeon]
MLEDSDTAKGQLQRVDHLIYVTLKYTRTIDVINNTLSRLIEAMDYIFLDILEIAKRKKMINIIPQSHVERIEIIEKKLFKNNKKIKEWVKLYLLMRKIVKNKIKGREEYRKNVTLIAEKVEVNQEKLMSYFVSTKEFYQFSREWIDKNGGMAWKEEDT